MNNQMQFVCLWCCADFAVQNQFSNSFSLLLFSTAILKRREKELISKTSKYKLDSSSKMEFAFFYLRDILNFLFWKTIDFVKNLNMTQGAKGGGH